MDINVKELLATLIVIADKAARISHICRLNFSELFHILIQEKNDDTKNPKFVHDFKTFADVIIQEMAKHCLEAKFPGLAQRVYGEETNQFENKLGESIVVQIDPEEPCRTKEMFVKIFDGDEQAAKSIVSVIYGQDDVDMPLDQLDHSLNVDAQRLAFWIDPIDSTSEYIAGKWEDSPDASKMTSGLQCVTCLFGVFDIHTGLPLMGVVSQPFFQIQTQANGKKMFASRCIWGFDIDGARLNNIHSVITPTQTQPPRDRDIVLVGGNESEDIRQQLEQMSQTVYVAGAGHKLLWVALGYADLLVSTSKSTYFWDTCSGHAVLRSMGGGLISLQDVGNLGDPNKLEAMQIRYFPKIKNNIEHYCNSRGLIAYSCPTKLSNYVHAIIHSATCKSF